MSGYQYQCEDAVEPISDTFGEQATNAVLYNVVSGCAVTPSASDLTVATALGLITGFSATAAVSASASAWTLIPDASLPRWGWLAYGLTGTPAIVQGDPATVPTVPELGDRVAAALYYIQAALTIAANATYRLDKRVPAPDPKHLNNYTGATQTVSASTTFADVVGALTTGSAASKFSFDAVASGVYQVTISIPLTFTSTGGAKFQFTGPSSPTAFKLTCQLTVIGADSGSTLIVPNDLVTTEAASGFSASFAAHNASVTSGASGGLYDSSTASLVVIRALLVNGANAGAVTLQIAQNSAAGTTVIGIGATMDVVKVA